MNRQNLGLRAHTHTHGHTHADTHTLYLTVGTVSKHLVAHTRIQQQEHTHKVECVCEGIRSYRQRLAQVSKRGDQLTGTRGAFQLTLKPHKVESKTRLLKKILAGSGVPKEFTRGSHG